MLSRPLYLGIVCLALAATLPAHASLIGQDVTVTFQEDTFSDVTTSVTVGGGQEIVAGDLSDIGMDIMLGGEFFDIGESLIEYRVRGDGAPHAMAGYQTTGFGPSAVYRFTDLFWNGEPGFITGVTVELVDVIGVALGSEVTFTANSVSLFIGTLGVMQAGAGPDLGTILLQLEVTHEVPEPSVLLLLLTAIPGLALRSRQVAADRA